MWAAVVEFQYQMAQTNTDPVVSLKCRCEIESAKNGEILLHFADISKTKTNVNQIDDGRVCACVSIGIRFHRQTFGLPHRIRWIYECRASRRTMSVLCPDSSIDIESHRCNVYLGANNNNNEWCNQSSAGQFNPICSMRASNFGCCLSASISVIFIHNSCTNLYLFTPTTHWFDGFF